VPPKRHEGFKGRKIWDLNDTTTACSMYMAVIKKIRWIVVSRSENRSATYRAPRERSRRIPTLFAVNLGSVDQMILKAAQTK
jgi:hypothetical protein